MIKKKTKQIKEQEKIIYYEINKDNIDEFVEFFKEKYNNDVIGGSAYLQISGSTNGSVERFEEKIELEPYSIDDLKLIRDLPWQGTIKELTKWLDSEISSYFSDQLSDLIPTIEDEYSKELTHVYVEGDYFIDISEEDIYEIIKEAIKIGIIKPMKRKISEIKQKSIIEESEKMFKLTERFILLKKLINKQNK